MQIHEKELVLVRLNENQRSFKAWLRVKFIDNDNTFMGEIELVDKDYTLHKIGEIIKLYTDVIQPIRIFFAQLLDCEIIIFKNYLFAH